MPFAEFREMLFLSPWPFAICLLIYFQPLQAQVRGADGG